MREVTLDMGTKTISIKIATEELYSLINAIEQQDKFSIKMFDDKPLLLIFTIEIKSYTITTSCHDGE